MTILYIHGLDSSPNPERIGLLEAHGHRVVALHIDYRTEADIYPRLVDFAKEEGVDYLVGSSLGGYLAYWIGHDLGLPQLLFNPAVAMRSITLDAPYPIAENPEIQSKVVLGVLDESVPHNDNVAFFKNRPWARVISCHWLAHQIDFPTYKEVIAWAGL